MQVGTDEQLVQQALAVAEKSRSGAQLRTPAELADIVVRFASSDGWMEKVRLRTEHRWYERQYLGPDYDIWVISWLPGQSTGYHDHGASSGAFVVATGILKEHRPGDRSRVIRPRKPRAFGPEYAHDVRNVSLAPAVSIHAYSPPLSDMNEYELEGIRLVPREREPREAETFEQEGNAQNGEASNQTAVLSIEQVLSAARARLRRLSAVETYEAKIKTQATLVDIRPEAQRAIEGSIAGALVVERNVLEWRFDPASRTRLPVAANHDIPLILFCSEGYSSSLAASALQNLGLHRTTDMIGGFQAWKAAGLPFTPAKNPCPSRV
jgi:rhodanese-related sulfurtransferase